MKWGYLLGMFRNLWVPSNGGASTEMEGLEPSELSLLLLMPNRTESFDDLVYRVDRTTGGLAIWRLGHETWLGWTRAGLSRG